MRAIYGFRVYGRARKPIRANPEHVLALWAEGQSTYEIRWSLLRQDGLAVSEAEIANFIAAYRDANHQTQVAA
jgi:hypothetical protein